MSWRVLVRITRRSVGTGLLPDRGSWQDTANLSDERGYNRGNFHVLLRKIRTTKTCRQTPHERTDKKPGKISRLPQGHTDCTEIRKDLKEIP
ncbi:hypothetical protein DXD01_12155 [Phocaeicola vulgatus]|nr:hypothetical protein DXD01_12155 [Phocaeicola vulgatus]